MIIFKYLRVFITVFIFVTAFQSQANGGAFTVFGPVDYTRAKGAPVRVATSFSFHNPNTIYTIVIANGGNDGQWQRVSSAQITLNGTTIVGPREWNQNAAVIERPVQLSTDNHIEVELRSRPGSGVTIEIIGVDNDLPSIQALVTPPPNQFGWHRSDVEVVFECSDQTSGIATCPDPVVVSTEGAAQIITREAIDVAGNTSSASVTVNLDKTPPTISRSWTPADDFSTDLNTVEIVGQINDNISGVGGGAIEDYSGTTGLAIPEFSIQRDLQTDILPGEVSKKTHFTISAIDLADNSSQQTFVVRYTQSAYMLPMDPNRTEVDQDGVVTSVEKALVRFDPLVTLSQIHTIIGSYGGKVDGFLPLTNTVGAIFPTDTLAELELVLQSLRSESQVTGAFPSFLFGLSQDVVFDNDILNLSEHNSIRSSEAAQFLIDNEIPLNFVHIAILDTGLNPSYGLNNEFAADIKFYDLTTPEGREGQEAEPVDFSGHGTMITGIIAGENNGEGNNGLIRGIPGSQFEVTNIKKDTHHNGITGYDGLLTSLELVASGVLGDFDVVNMSFITYVDNNSQSDLDRIQLEKDYLCDLGQDILWIAATGNDDNELQCIPSDLNTEFRSVTSAGLSCICPNVVGVSGYTYGTDEKAIFSNYGELATISAPYFAYTADSVDGYGTCAGTSCAAPLVSGAAALALAANTVSPSMMKECLAQTTRPLNDPLLPEGGLDVEALIKGFGTHAIYDNGPNTDSTGSAIGHLIAADDFQLWGARLLTGASVDVNDRPDPGRWDGTVEWWIFSDDSGRPGNVIASGLGQNVELSNLVESSSGFRDFTVDFDFGEQIGLAGGETYWLGLHLAANYDHLSVFWYNTADYVRGNESYSGGEIIGGIPNFVDGSYGGPTGYDKSFRLKTIQGECVTSGLPVVEVACPCFSADDLDAIDWDMWCSGPSFEYLLDNTNSSDPAPLVDAGLSSDLLSCSTGSFYNPVMHITTEAQAWSCAQLIIDTAMSQGTERACRID